MWWAEAVIEAMKLHFHVNILAPWIIIANEDYSYSKCVSCCKIWIICKWIKLRVVLRILPLDFNKMSLYHFSLTHRGRVTHICVSKLTIIGSDNGLSPIRSLGTNFSEILSEVDTFSFTKLHLKVSSAKWRQFCLNLSALTRINYGLLVTPKCVTELGHHNFR